MAGPANPWHDGGSSLPAWLLLRILLAAVSPAAIAHGGATGTRGSVTHAAAAPCDPRRRLAELASVCRAWLAALGANDVARELCLTLHHLPAVLPADMWRGALAPQPGDRVVSRSRQRGTVLSVDRSYDEPSFVVQLDDGPVRDCDAAKLQPTAPWRKLHLLLAAHETTRPARPPQPRPGEVNLLQFGAMVLPRDFAYTQRYGKAQLDGWEAELRTQLAELQSALFDALRMAGDNGVALLDAQTRLRHNWEQRNDVALAREAMAYVARRDAARNALLRPTPSASGRAREAAEATLLRIQRTFSAELEAVQSDMRDAFTHGFRNNDRLPGWRAALAREATQLAAALAAVDAVSAAGCSADDRMAVVVQRGVAAEAIQQRIEAVQLMQATCAALWRAFGALRLVDAPPAAAPA